MPPLPASDSPQPFVVRDGLAVYRFGAGEPVFLMPGPHRFARPGLSSSDMLTAGLVRLGRQVITYDPPESGHSTRPAHLGMAEMHDCADEALAVCGVSGPVDAIGHSMSGLAVLAYAIERPARVRRLVLVGTGAGSYYRRAPGALWNRTHPRFWKLALLGIFHIAVPLRAPQVMLFNLIERESVFNPALAEIEPVTLRDWLRRPEGRTDWQYVANRLDYTPRLGEISAPTLVLCGRHDPQFPPACSQALAAHIPRARAVYFERSGHYPYLDEPDAFWQAVAEFLEAAA